MNSEENLPSVPHYTAGGKVARKWRWPPTPPSAEVKEVELYLCPPSGNLWPCSKINIIFYFYTYCNNNFDKILFGLLLSDCIYKKEHEA